MSELQSGVVVDPRAGRRRARRPKPVWSPRPEGEPSLAELEFPGCVSRRMTVAEHEAAEERIEFFDTRTGIAWVAGAGAFEASGLSPRGDLLDLDAVRGRFREIVESERVPLPKRER